MKVTMLGEDLYQYDFEPVTMNGYYDPTIDAYERGQLPAGQYMGQNLPDNITIFDVPDEEVIASRDARKQIEKTNPEKANNIKTIASEVRRGITDIATVVRDGILTRQDAKLARDEADDPVMDKNWFERNQTAVILGGTGLAALIIIGMTMQRRRRRR